jgi:quercetin dioxygenase-like cupin family protein
MTDASTVSRRILLVGAAAAAFSNYGRAQGATPKIERPGRIAMNIIRSGSQPSTKGSSDYFTGIVRLDMPFKGTAPARVGGATVTFEPGARTAWHTHPLGQTLIVVSGMGWVRMEGGPKQDIRAGDIVWIPRGEKHWHGATATTAMSHIAIAEALDGKTVDWMEKVTDTQFNG